MPETYYERRARSRAVSKKVCWICGITMIVLIVASAVLQGIEEALKQLL